MGKVPNEEKCNRIYSVVLLEIFDIKYRALSDGQRIKLHGAIELLFNDPYLPSLDIRRIGEPERRMFSVCVEGDLRLAFRDRTGIAELWNVDIDERLDLEEYLKGDD